MHILKNLILSLSIFAFVFVILVFIVLRYWSLIFGEKILWKNYKVIQKQINGNTYKLVVAENPKQHAQGLMFVRKPVEFDGMIFRFPQSQPQLFWNMNTLVDLKLYWLNGETIVGTSLMPSIEKSTSIVTVSSPSAVNTVIEIIQ